MLDNSVEALCLALRHVGIRDEELPAGNAVKGWIAEVQRLDAALQHDGIALSTRLATLSEETGWDMARLLEDCRRYPATIPYVRLRNGVRRVFACAVCRQREVAERDGVQWCAFCRQRAEEDRHQRPPITEIDMITYLRGAIAALRAHGITTDPGLSDRDVAAAEDYLGVPFPPDLRLFLQLAVPSAPGFPNWRLLNRDLDAQLRWPTEGLCFDVEHNDLWQEGWGSKPQRIQDACRLLTLQVQHAPRLIPIRGHRYLPADPARAGNPVFSVYQADIVYYGLDLAGYFALEFGIPLPDWAARVPRPIRFWDDFL